MPRERLVAHDVGDRDAPAHFEHAEDLAHKPRLVLVSYEVEHAIGDYEVDARIGDERRLTMQLLPRGFECAEVGSVPHGMLREPGVETIEIERKILDASPAELDIGESDLLGHQGCCMACEVEHLLVHVDADHAAFGSRDLRGNKADLAAAAPGIEDHVSLTHVARGVSATVI